MTLNRYIVGFTLLRSIQVFLAEVDGAVFAKVAARRECFVTEHILVGAPQVVGLAETNASNVRRVRFEARVNQVVLLQWKHVFPQMVDKWVRTCSWWLTSSRNTFLEFDATKRTSIAIFVSNWCIFVCRYTLAIFNQIPISNLPYISLWLVLKFLSFPNLD